MDAFAPGWNGSNSVPTRGDEGNLLEGDGRQNDS